MPFLAVLWKNDRRRADGMVADPPRLFVVRHNLEMDSTEIHPVEWPVAEALAPQALSGICDRIDHVRERLYREYDAKLRSLETSPGN